jgi:hypothetical protein
MRKIPDAKMRIQRIHVRLSEIEYGQITELAKQSGKTAAEVLRYYTLAKKHSVPSISNEDAQKILTVLHDVLLKLTNIGRHLESGFGGSWEREFKIVTDLAKLISSFIGGFHGVA